MTAENHRFSSETGALALAKIGLMRTHVISASFAVAVALAALSGPVTAADSPLDFSYRVTGASDVRPLLVFNDGADTFIQPQDPSDKTMLVNGAVPVRQGPYFVVHGVGSEITISQGNKASARIAYTKTTAVRPQAAANPIAEVRTAAAIPVQPKVGETKVQVAKAVAKEPEQAVPDAKPVVQKPAICQPRREQRDSAFVATFKSGTSVLSDLAKAEVNKFVGDTTSITGVDVIAEGAGKIPGQKRAEAIKSVLVGAGIEAGKIDVSVRSPTGIGSEIHIHRTTEIPCGSSVVRMPSRKGNVSIIWDRDAKELAERIAAELKVKLTVTGTVRPLPVRVAAVDLPFGEAMQRVGQALDEGADLILRTNELVLSFKEKQ